MENGNKNFKLYIIIAIVIIIGAILVYKLAFGDNSSSLVNISVSELETKIDKKNSFVLVISQTGCRHCEQYLPELDRTLSDYDMNAYVLNVSELSDEENKTLAQYVNFSGTPTTIFIENGEETTTLNRIVGYASKNKITERLKSLGYVD